MTTVTLDLPDGLHKRLVAFATQTGRTELNCVCQALEQYLDDAEDVYLVEAALERHKAANYQTVSHHDLGIELGLLDDGNSLDVSKSQ